MVTISLANLKEDPKAIENGWFDLGIYKTKIVMRSSSKQKE